MWTLSMTVLYTVLCTVSSSPTQCEFRPPNNLKFSIISRRNITGHWIAQVKFHHGANGATELQELGPWEVDVDHTTTRCQGVESVTIETIVSAPPRRPGPNYEFVPGLGYYKLHTMGKPWQEARSICNQEGAHLAIINSDQEAAELISMLSRRPKLFADWRNDYAAIGINDFRTEGEWVTIFGQPLNCTGYMKWAPRQPDQGRIGNCGLMQRTGELHDVTCESGMAFICEQEV